MRTESQVDSMIVPPISMAGRFRLVIATALCPLLFASGRATADITASTATDVCAATADPCVVTTLVNIVSGSVLDFGTRAVSLQSSGQLSFGNGAATVLCGDFTAQSWSYPRIIVRAVEGEGYKGGDALIVSRGSCSSDSTIPCLGDEDCGAGDTCTAGTGNIILNAEVLGWANPGGWIKLTAFGNFSSTKLIDMSNGNYDYGDGGAVHIVSTTGSITTGGVVSGRGGTLASGGSIRMTAATTITINAEVKALGGSNGGGEISLESGTDMTINAPLSAYSDYSSGSGGTVSLAAVGNMTIGGSKTINTSGHRNTNTGVNGNGGQQEYIAEGSITIGNNAQLLASAANTTSAGNGGSITLTGCAVTVNGGAVVQANGATGGSIQLMGGDSVTVNNTSSVDSSGTSAQDLILTTSATANNPNTYGTQTQFSPAPDIEEDDGLPSCP